MADIETGVLRSLGKRALIALALCAWPSLASAASEDDRAQEVCRTRRLYDVPAMIEGLKSPVDETVSACLVGLSLLDDPRAQEALRRHPGARVEDEKTGWPSFDAELLRVTRVEPGEKKRLGPLLTWVESAFTDQRRKDVVVWALCEYPTLYISGVKEFALSPDNPIECAAVLKREPYATQIRLNDEEVHRHRAERVQRTAAWILGALFAAAALTGASYLSRDRDSGRPLVAFNGLLSGAALGLAGVLLAAGDVHGSEADMGGTGYVVGMLALATGAVGAVFGLILGYRMAAQPGRSRPIFSAIALVAAGLACVLVALR